MSIITSIQKNAKKGRHFHLLTRQRLKKSLLIADVGMLPYTDHGSVNCHKCFWKVNLSRGNIQVQIFFQGHLLQ